MIRAFKTILKAILNWRYIWKVTLAIRWQIDNLHKAIPIFESLLKKYPNDGPVLAMLGMALIRKDEIQRGVDSLKKSLKQIKEDDKHLPEIYAYLGYGSLVLNSYNEGIKYNLLALEHWDESVNKSPVGFSKQQIYENLGLSYEGESQLNDAISYYKKALSIDTKDTSLIERLARAYYLNGEYYEARRQLNRMISIDPSLENDDRVKEAAMIIDKGLKDTWNTGRC